MTRKEFEEEIGIALDSIETTETRSGHVGGNTHRSGILRSDHKEVSVVRMTLSKVRGMGL